MRSIARRGAGSGAWGPWRLSEGAGRLLGLGGLVLGEDCLTAGSLAEAHALCVLMSRSYLDGAARERRITEGAFQTVFGRTVEVFDTKSES